MGDKTQTASSFGEVEAHDYFFPAGESYEISLDHLGTDLDFLAANGEAFAPPDEITAADPPTRALFLRGILSVARWHDARARFRG